jgi:hypothetical protein
MFALLASHFTGVRPARFESDLAEKSAVILLEDDDGVLRGFSTMLVYETRAAGRPMTIVYSGDTIVERAWWGSPALARTWIQAVRTLVAGTSASGSPSRDGSTPGSARDSGAGPWTCRCDSPLVAPDRRDVYWLLLTSGFRTYRFLPVFYQSFHPRFDLETPPDTQALIDALAAERFGSRYDRSTGIVRFEEPQVLAGDLIEVPDGRADDAHVRFFLERNPGFVAGDELVCLARIHDDNLTAAARRMVRQATRSTSCG